MKFITEMLEIFPKRIFQLSVSVNAEILPTRHFAQSWLETERFDLKSEPLIVKPNLRFARNSAWIAQMLRSLNYCIL